MIAGPHLTFEFMKPVYVNEEEYSIRNKGRSITFVYKDQSVAIMDQKEEQEMQEKLEELSPEKQKLMDSYDQNIKTLDDLKELNSDWKKVGEKKDAMGHSKKCEKKGLSYSRGEAKVNAPVEIVIDLLTNPEKNDVTNPGVKVEKVLMQITDQISLHYDVSGVPLIDDRYSVFVVGNQKKADGTLALYVVSCDYNDIEKPKNAVRCDVKQAWYIKKMSDNETNVVQISCIDPGGKIPDFIKGKIINKRGLEQVMTVKNYCEKEIKKLNKK